MSGKIFLLLCALLLTEIVTADSDCSNLNSLVRIRNQVSGLMLDASNGDIITIEQFNRTGDQEWLFQLSNGVGLFNIISGSTGLALDINPEANSDNANSFNLTLNDLSDSWNQRWYINSDGTIINAGFGDGISKFAINIPYSNYDPGSFLIAFPLSGELTENERFILEFGVKKYIN